MPNMTATTATVTGCPVCGQPAARAFASYVRCTVCAHVYPVPTTTDSK